MIVSDKLLKQAFAILKSRNLGCNFFNYKENEVVKLFIESKY